MNNENKFSKPNIGPPELPIKKFIVFSIMFVVGVMLLIVGNSNQSNINSAIKKVKDLYVSDVEVMEGESSKIKESTDQLKIDEAIKAINKIDSKGGKCFDSVVAIIGLNASILVAQKQLEEREGIESLEEIDSHVVREEHIDQYQPGEDDVIWVDNDLKNKDLMEEFMKNSGGNGKSNDLKIRTVRDFGKNGVLIFDIKSVYADYADQGWIEVKVDYSHYTPTVESNYIDTFVKRPQQCSHISKNFELDYYVFNECYTDLEYPFLPFRSEEIE